MSRSSRARLLERVDALDASAERMLGERAVPLHPVHVQTLELIDLMVTQMRAGSSHDPSVGVLLRVLNATRPRLERSLSTVDPGLIVTWLHGIAAELLKVGAPPALPAAPAPAVGE